MRDAFPDFLAALVLGVLTKLRAAGRTEGECIAHGVRPGLARVTERAHQRSPLETQPDSALEGVQMRILYGAARREQPELRLNAVKELVQHQLASRACIGHRRDEVPHE